MAVTTTYSITAAETYLDLVEGPGLGEIDIVSLANGGLAITSTNGGLTDLDIINPNGSDGGGTLNLAGTLSAVSQLTNGNILIVTQLANGSCSYTIRNSVGGEVVFERIMAAQAVSPDAAGLSNGNHVFVSATTGGSFPADDIRIGIPQNSSVQNLFFASSGAIDARPSVTGLDGGGFAVAWSASRNGVTEVWYAVYENNGAIRLPPALLDSTGTVYHEVSIANIAGGGFAIAYEDNADAGANTDIRLVICGPTGSVLDRGNASNPSGVVDYTNELRPYLARMDNGMLALSYTRDDVGMVIGRPGGPQVNAAADDDTLVRVYDPLRDVLSAAALVDVGQNPRLDVQNSAVAEYGDGKLAVFHRNVSDNDAEGEVMNLTRLSVGNGADDVIKGDYLLDTMRGGGGSDIYFVDNIGDTVTEENVAGIDTVNSSVTFSIAGQFVEILNLTGAKSINGTGSNIDNTINGNGGKNTLIGAGGDDVLNGGAGDDNLIGGTDNDTLNGGSGNDRMEGGSGNDTFTGGSGNDRLIGGSGLDVYVFNTSLGTTNVDIFQDFNRADDTIWLDDDVFTKAGAVGALAGGAFYNGKAAHDSDDRIVYDQTTGNLFYDRDGIGGATAVRFAVVENLVALSSSDFVIVA